MKTVLAHKFEKIVSIENLLEAWKGFIKGKRQRQDVQEFQFQLMDNILQVHQDLANHSYKHGEYQAFNISDPKPRNIHKATVRDRLLHHAVYRVLYPFFDRTFTSDSFSCRNNKGTHKALNRFRSFSYQVSKNNTKTAWILKCDVRKFFANIDQKILLDIMKSYIPDQDIIWLLSQVIGSFYSTKKRLGLPLGNLTSQLLVNIYMNRFDQFVKHKLKVQYYIRYADDFVILSQDKKWLETTLVQISDFLQTKLGLELHPHKVSIKTMNSGVDFLGWVHFPDHRVLRTTTKRRMLKNIEAKKGETATVQSYLGLMSHGNTKKIKNFIETVISSEMARRVIQLNYGKQYEIDSEGCVSASFGNY